MDRERALDVCRKAVGLASSEDVLATLSETRLGSTRYSGNAITQNVAERRAMLTVRVAFGKRRGDVSINRFEDASLEAAVARAEAIAKVAPEDDEHMPPVGPADYRALPAGDPATSGTTPTARAEGVRRIVEEMGDGDLEAAGAYATHGTDVAFTNGRGAEGFHTRSSADAHCTVLGETASGWAEEVSRSTADVDPARVARRAHELAEMAANPREIEPGEYTVVLGPAALCELLAFLVFTNDAKAADEGRSALSGKEGQPIGSEKVTVRSVLDDPAWPGMPFDAEGVPLDDVTWIDRGTLKTMRTTRFWAEKSGRPYAPYPGTIGMEGSDLTTEDLIAKVDRGLYVTRFWYTRFVDPMTLLLTGMTRDALFLIEDGRIASGVKHLRYNDSPLRVLSAVREVGRPEIASMYLRGRIPPVLVDGFRFTSGTSF
jgi:predicted Zn-dependent protease